MTNWRDEPLTKGEMYDALMEAAESVEANVTVLKRHFKIIPGFTKVAKPVTKLTVDILRGTASAISGGTSGL